MKHLRTFTGILLLASLAILQISCDQKSSTGPGSSTQLVYIGNIALYAVEDELYSVQGNPVSTDITATVTDTSGAAMQGILVEFSAPEFGSVSTTEATTDEEGNVTVTFNSLGFTGIATVTATVVSGLSTYSSSIPINVYELTGFVHDITLSLNPPVVYLDEGENSSIEATVYVMDSLNVGIPGIHVTFSTTQGVIAYADTTNTSGAIVTYLNTNDEYGMGVVTASAVTPLEPPPDTTSGSGSGPTIPTTPSGGKITPRQSDDLFTITAADTFWVLSVASDQITGISVSASPQILYVAPNQTGTSEIRATVVDSNNVGVEGVPISFSTNMGSLEAGPHPTDASGSVTVIYTSAPNETGNALITALVGNYSDTTTVMVNATSQTSGSMTLASNRYIIYADFGITYADVRATLKDSDDQVIAGVEVIFTSNYGTVNSPVFTDSLGQANALFVDTGIPSFPDSAMLIAKYPTLNVADTINIMISPALGVDYIDLNPASLTIQANGIDSTKVDALVWLDNGTLAPTGTAVNFLRTGAPIGSFYPVTAYITENGIATSYYRAGSSTGVDTIRAEVEGVYSASMAMHLVAGSPFYVTISASAPSIYVNSLESITIEALITDSTRNLVADNEIVIFEVNLGVISPPAAQTVNGIATADLSSGTNAGGATVKATAGMAVDSILVMFLPTFPSQVGLSAEHSHIDVQGTGGEYQTEIYALVTDPQGNPVGNDVWVNFKIMNNGFPQGGVNINYVGYQDSAQTIGGTATVVLNAGDSSGTVTIKAWTYDESSNEIWAQGPLVTISSGPPASMEIAIDGDNINRAGGGVWQLETSVKIMDIHNNPVVDSTAVHFYLVPDEYAQIEGDAVTGNENWAGETDEGVAYTTLNYSSEHIYDVITVYALIMVYGDSILDSIEYVLPLAEGELLLFVNPIAWDFDEPPYGNPGEPARMQCDAYLIDGYNNPVNDALILFTSPKGQGYWNQQGTIPTNGSWLRYTGPGGYIGEPYDSTGWATIWLITTFNQAFPDPNALETTAQINCVVYGTDVGTTSPITVTFIHHADSGEPPNNDQLGILKD